MDNNNWSNGTDNEANININSNQTSSPYTFRGGSQEGYQSEISQQVMYHPTQYKADKKAPRRRNWFSKVVTFTAAAVLFGVVAGAAASGYDYLTRPKEEVIVLEEEIDEQLAAVPTKSEDGTTAVQTITDKDQVVTDVSDVVDKVMPSIVAINSTTINSYNFFGREYNEPIDGNGSGIIIGQNDESILILTNNHVIANTNSVEIVFSDETVADATVKGSEESSDLAVLEVSMDDLSEDTLNSIKVARLGDSDNLKAGEMVIAIGNALGYGQSVTVGYVSALERTIVGVDMTLIQTDAAINPGNSGGALLNTSGELVGVNTIKFADELVEGMGYAIPISDAVPVINELVDRRVLAEAERGFLGVDLETAEEVDEMFSQQFNMPVGVYIKEIVEGSPADEAGLKPGIIISGFNSLRIKTINDLVEAISYSEAGEKVTLKVSIMIDGEYSEKELEVILGERP